MILTSTIMDAYKELDTILTSKKVIRFVTMRKKQPIDDFIECVRDILDVELLENLQIFYKELFYQRRLSFHTLLSYNNDINQFFIFLNKEKCLRISINILSDLHVKDIRLWLMALHQEKELKARSVARKLSSLRTFARFLKEQNEAFNHTAFFMIKGPKRPVLLPKTLTQEEGHRVLCNLTKNVNISTSVNANANSIQKNNDGIADPSWIRRRDLALFTLLYGCGVRISEALHLSYPFSRHCLQMSLIVFGKGKKERCIPMIPFVQECIRAYEESCPFFKKDNSTVVAPYSLFLGLRGGALSARQARFIMNKIKMRLDLPMAFTPHTLRHSFASHLLDNGGELRFIQELLGHESLSSTQIYTKVSKRMLEVFGNAHPRKLEDIKDL